MVGRPSKFETPEGYCTINPPWGILNAINMNTGKVVCKVPLGGYPQLKARGIRAGTENYGGPVVTAGGLVFIAATKDEKFRAFNKRTGHCCGKRICRPAVLLLRVFTKLMVSSI